MRIETSIVQYRTIFQITTAIRFIFQQSIVVYVSPRLDWTVQCFEKPVIGRCVVKLLCLFDQLLGNVDVIRQLTCWLFLANSCSFGAGEQPLKSAIIAVAQASLIFTVFVSLIHTPMGFGYDNFLRTWARRM